MKEVESFLAGTIIAVEEKQQWGWLRMILLDGSYLYGLGKAVQPAGQVTANDSYIDAYLKLYGAKDSLEGFITRSVYTPSLRLVAEPANTLIKEISGIMDKAVSDPASGSKVSQQEAWKLGEAYREFESILKAELKHGNMYLATRKGAFDVKMLIQEGQEAFPSALGDKVPAALPDVRQGAKCLAFELYTASGFHFHRANECVVLTYLDSLKVARPPNRNLGAYIDALGKAGAPPEIISCLRDLKDMHRNPLMHPEQSIEDLDSAIALLSAIHNAMSAMLKAIPVPS